MDILSIQGRKGGIPNLSIPWAKGVPTKRRTTKAEPPVSARVHSHRSTHAIQPAPKTSRHHTERRLHKPRTNHTRSTSQIPLTAAYCLKTHSGMITDYEKGEILEYKEIFYLGNPRKKIRASNHEPNNMGYDDERGDYVVVNRDHLSYRYEVLQLLGKGSFGQVLKCFDYKTNKHVAVKIIRNQRQFHQQAQIEVKILKKIKDADPSNSTNIIKLKRHFFFRNHLCIVFPLLSINLFEFIQNRGYQGVSLGLIRRFAVQLLTAMMFLHKRNIIHCDVKPENILMKDPKKSGIMLIDFGSSCYVRERIYTYIQSRFYRAPEVILGLPYSTGIDIWSFGCILAELYTGMPLFAGENEFEQLACIIEVMGLPSKSLISRASRRRQFFNSGGYPRQMPNARGSKRKIAGKSLASALHCSDTLFLDFLRGCLMWNSDRRMTAEECFMHEWIQEGHVQVSSVGSRSSSVTGRLPKREHKRSTDRFPALPTGVLNRKDSRDRVKMPLLSGVAATKHYRSKPKLPTRYDVAGPTSMAPPPSHETTHQFPQRRERRHVGGGGGFAFRSSQVGGHGGVAGGALLAPLQTKANFLLGQGF